MRKKSQNIDPNIDKIIERVIKEELQRKCIVERIDNYDDMLLEMANISTQTTGLKCVVWVQTQLPGNSGQHNLPRIKFQYNNQLYPISISKQPQLLGNVSIEQIGIKAKELAVIQKWIILNHDVLLDLWNGAITTDQLFTKLKRV